MEENASRAVFIGVSVLVAIITLTLILNFYNTARDSAGEANRYDITVYSNQYVTELLNKKSITGLELRYLVDFFLDNEGFRIKIFNSETDRINNNKLELDYNNYWEQEFQEKMDNLIRPNYQYSLKVKENGNYYDIQAVLKY